MKSWILDESDCAASPLLRESRARHRWGRRAWTDTYLVRFPKLESRSHPKISGLTEQFFSGIQPGYRFETQLDLFQ